MYRKGTLDDCKAVYDLICEMECKQLPFDRFSEIFTQQIQDDHYYCLVCEQENCGQEDFEQANCRQKNFEQMNCCQRTNVIGVLNLRFENQLHHAGYIAEILEFAISPSYRNQGLGKGMFAAACEIAKASGCIQIEVSCNQLRKDTHRFYMREGMHNFHFKFSKSLTGTDTSENAIGR